MSFGMPDKEGVGPGPLMATAAGMCLAGVVMAQSTTGSIYGAVPAGTVVTITSSTGLTPPDGDGRSRWPLHVGNLPAGDYKVEAKGLGSRDVTVTVGGGADASFAALRRP